MPLQNHSSACEVVLVRCCLCSEDPFLLIGKASIMCDKVTRQKTLIGQNLPFSEYINDDEVT